MMRFVWFSLKSSAEFSQTSSGQPSDICSGFACTGRWHDRRQRMALVVPLRDKWARCRQATSRAAYVHHQFPSRGCAPVPKTLSHSVLASTSKVFMMLRVYYQDKLSTAIGSQRQHSDAVLILNRRTFEGLCILDAPSLRVRWCHHTQRPHHRYAFKNTATNSLIGAPQLRLRFTWLVKCALRVIGSGNQRRLIACACSGSGWVGLGVNAGSRPGTRPQHRWHRPR